jgi:hypothetical protein
LVGLDAATLAVLGILPASLPAMVAVTKVSVVLGRCWKEPRALPARRGVPSRIRSIRKYCCWRSEAAHHDDRVQDMRQSLLVCEWPQNRFVQVTSPQPTQYAKSVQPYLQHQYHTVRREPLGRPRLTGTNWSCRALAIHTAAVEISILNHVDPYCPLLSNVVFSCPYNK